MFVVVARLACVANCKVQASRASSYGFGELPSAGSCEEAHADSVAPQCACFATVHKKKTQLHRHSSALARKPSRKNIGQHRTAEASWGKLVVATIHS
jgi:hypothetical protein